MSTAGSRLVLETLAPRSVSDRILDLYELGIQACADGAQDDVTAILAELMGTLDLDCGDIAEAFARLYEFCLDRADAGDLTQVGWVLTDLRDAWREAARAARRGARPVAPAAW